MAADARDWRRSRVHDAGRGSSPASTVILARAAEISTADRAY
jgi:hypothetical protein